MRISDWSSDVCSSDLSVVIGDRETDMQLAQNLGCRGLRLAPGHHDWAQIAHLLADAPRTAQVQRTTRETDIHVSIDLDRVAEPQVHTGIGRSEEHTSDIQSLMRISYAVFCLNKNKKYTKQHTA